MWLNAPKIIKRIGQKKRNRERGASCSVKLAGLGIVHSGDDVQEVRAISWVCTLGSTFHVEA